MRNLGALHEKAALVLATALGAAEFSAATPRESEWRWRGAVSPEKSIQILAVRGTVRVEGYDGDTVEVAALRRSSDADPEVVQIVFHETADEFRIVTEYPAPPLGPPRECLWYDPVRGNFWDYFVLVDLSVRVPRKNSISIHTYAGDVSVSNLAGFVVVSTNGGTVRLEGLEGKIEARAEGSIVADLTHEGPGSGSVFLSVNVGNLDLILKPLDRLRIDSRVIVPELTSPISILRADGPLPATVEGTLEGGRRVTIRAKRGAARVSTVVAPSPR